VIKEFNLLCDSLSNNIDILITQYNHFSVIVFLRPIYSIFNWKQSTAISQIRRFRLTSSLFSFVWETADYVSYLLHHLCLFSTVSANIIFAYLRKTRPWTHKLLLISILWRIPSMLILLDLVRVALLQLFIKSLYLKL